MMGLPLQDWQVYCEPAHAQVYTKPNTPEMAKVNEQNLIMYQRLQASLEQTRQNPRPGLIQALVECTINGQTPSDEDLTGVLILLIGGGFDTTTALTAHSLEWLSENPEQRTRLIHELDTLLDTATEEFLRFYTPAQGDGRTFTQVCEIAGVDFKEGERIWLSWAMANRDPKVFPNPNQIRLDRPNNRHSSFGLGIHRCIGSNKARMTFKTMMTAVLQRMPDYVCNPTGAVHYDTVGVINGLKHLPATFTPGRRLGAGLDETIAMLQKACDEQRLAEPVTVRHDAAKIGSLTS
jgi:cytochrome P450